MQRLILKYFNQSPMVQPGFIFGQAQKALKSRCAKNSLLTPVQFRCPALFTSPRKVGSVGHITSCGRVTSVRTVGSVGHVTRMVGSVGHVTLSGWVCWSRVTLRSGPLVASSRTVGSVGHILPYGRVRWSRHTIQEGLLGTPSRMSVLL